jgi:hypothetical protein
VLYGVSDAVVSTPYQPLREWLAFLLHVCPTEVLEKAFGNDGGQLVRLVPELEQLGISAADAGHAESDHYLLQSAATKLLTRLGRAQPLLTCTGLTPRPCSCCVGSHAPLRNRDCSSWRRTVTPGRR